MSVKDPHNHTWEYWQYLTLAYLLHFNFLDLERMCSNYSSLKHKLKELEKTAGNTY